MLDIMLAVLEDSTSSAPFTGDDFLRKLFPNFWSFLINLIALFVFVLVLFLLAYKPAKKFVQARKDYIEGNLKAGEEAKTKYEAMVKDSESIVVDARKRADEIVKQAQADANAEALRITTSARDEASRRISDADEAIKQAEEKARQSIQEEIVNVALDASKKVLGREINEDDNRRLVASFMNEIEGKDD